MEHLPADCLGIILSLLAAPELQAIRRAFKAADSVIVPARHRVHHKHTGGVFSAHGGIALHYTSHRSALCQYIEIGAAGGTKWYFYATTLTHAHNIVAYLRAHNDKRAVLDTIAAAAAKLKV